MCIIEYVGYSCGHSSVPVLRLCPMTTRATTNAVCKDPSHRPTMVGDMCPACSRVMHSRWVDIVMFEHQWMHERGTCGCPAKFPSLLHPRTIGADAGEEAKRYIGHNTTMQGISEQMGDSMRSKFKLDGGASTSSNEGSPGILTSSSTKYSSLAATTGIVGMETFGPPQRIAKHTATPTAVNQPSTGSSGQSKGKKKAHKSWKQKKKGKGKGKSKNCKQQKNNSNVDPFTEMTKPRDITRPLFSPIAAMSSEGMTESFQLAPLELSSSTTGRFRNASAGSSQQVNARLASHFAAEWIPEHAELHQMGVCHCHVRFDKYQPYKVTEAEYYSAKRGDSQGSTAGYLEIATGMEDIDLGRTGIRGGVDNCPLCPEIDSLPYSGVVDSSCITTKTDNGKGKRGQETSLFDPFAPSSSSPETARMGSSNNTGGSTNMSGVYPEYKIRSTRKAPYDNTAQYGPGPHGITDTPSRQFSHRTHTAAAQKRSGTENRDHTTSTAQGPPSSHSSRSNVINTREVLYNYTPEQILRPSDIAHWRAIEASPDADDDPERTLRRWAGCSTRPEDFGFRSVEEAARALAATHPEQATSIRSRPAPQVEAADHLASTLYYQHFDANDPATYPIVAWPLGAGPEGGPEYCYSPRWDVCHLSRPRLRRSRSLDASS
ncbi:hypothetical protein PG999_006622 [Apiospora kogelbergensis]|uniref:Uncharacterized protein n=1 Tax=Apiospora kogelbergensis TaxID=1337665 RepID=A0AAW0QVZ7_9PEZI